MTAKISQRGSSKGRDGVKGERGKGEKQRKEKKKETKQETLPTELRLPTCSQKPFGDCKDSFLLTNDAKPRLSD